MEKTQAQIKLGIISVLKLVILTFVLSVSFCIIASAEESGYCGENGGANLQWTLDDDGVLTISGSGKMADYTWGDWNDYEGLSEEEIDELMNGEIGFAGYSTAPWGGLTSSTITSIVIESGVTSIGNCAFYTCSGVQEAVTVPDSVTSIGE
ncbi:MAG: leucine-rich repeat domain-containing protein, partial [Clostridiales bacterium]|nr:leucine-rich repeat domain-containing protein [Clostridiales bacterium]